MADKKVRLQDGGGPWNTPVRPLPNLKIGTSTLNPRAGGQWMQSKPLPKLNLGSYSMNPQVTGGQWMPGRVQPKRNPYVANRTGGGADEFALAMERQRAWEELQKQRSVDTANKRVAYLQARQGNAGALGYGDMGANSNLNMGLYDTNWQNWRDVPKNWINEKLYEQNLPPDDTSDGGGGGYYGGYGGYSGGGGSRGGYNPYAWYFSLLNWRI